MGEYMDFNPGDWTTEIFMSMASFSALQGKQVCTFKQDAKNDPAHNDCVQAQASVPNCRYLLCVRLHANSSGHCQPTFSLNGLSGHCWSHDLVIPVERQVTCSGWHWEHLAWTILFAHKQLSLDHQITDKDMYNCRQTAKYSVQIQICELPCVQNDFNESTF